MKIIKTKRWLLWNVDEMSWINDRSSRNLQVCSMFVDVNELIRWWLYNDVRFPPECYHSIEQRNFASISSTKRHIHEARKCVRTIRSILDHRLFQRLNFEDIRLDHVWFLKTIILNIRMNEMNINWQ